MSKNLVIVESPGKVSTIEKFLGPDFRVMSSKGHVRDIEGAGRNSIGIDFENGYTPNYVIDSQKTALIASLRKEADAADVVWLASDPDREGEAIAWHLKQVLELPDAKTRRVAYPELIESVVLEAFKNPRDIDYNLVNAQQARRVLDRIVGFELSPILWRKVTKGLSAGRVQSVVVRLVVEREREIENFKEVAQYRVTADFIEKNGSEDDMILHTELNHRFQTKAEAIDFLQCCKDRDFKVVSVSKKPGKRTPAPPFTTSTLQQEAARKLKFPVSKTMRLAQSLYEAGRITYMRTDSVNLSSLAIATAREEILSDSNLGERYHHARQFHTTSKGAQEAHEAIRPSYMSVHSAGKNQDEKRLYELIWKRTLASQMSDAEIESSRIEVGCEGMDYLFVATGEVVLFDGFMRAYVQSTDDETQDTIRLLPSLVEGTHLVSREFVAQQTFSKAPFRYTDASLVKKMEDLQIGRPSTYSTIIETIQTRHYVERGNVQGVKREYNVLTLRNNKLIDKTKFEMVGQDSQKLLPTDLGRLTNDFLVEQFPNILSYDFTAREEENFDSIAAGQADWVQTVDNFYKAFHPHIKTIPSGKVAARFLGNDPVTGAPVFAKISKIGPCVQIGEADMGKPRFVSIPKEMSIYTITLAEALNLFETQKPAVICQVDGQDVVTGNGKFGPYIRFGATFISIPKGMDPKSLMEEDVIRLVEDYRKQAEPICRFGDILVLHGRYGAYLKTPSGNCPLPKDKDPQTLTEEECKQIISTYKASQSHVRRNSKI